MLRKSAAGVAVLCAQMNVSATTMAGMTNAASQAFPYRPEQMTGSSSNAVRPDDGPGANASTVIAATVTRSWTVGTHAGARLENPMTPSSASATARPMATRSQTGFRGPGGTSVLASATRPATANGAERRTRSL